jgi:excisionase family DNA binding protein
MDASVPAALESRLEKLLFSVTEAAQFLGLRTYSIRKLCRSGQIPHIVVSGKLKFSPAALRKWATDGCRPPRRGPGTRVRS